MTDQLTGRALDEACAKAMGYTISDCYGPGTVQWLRPDGIETVYGGYGGELPCFSSDIVLLPKLLTWLEGRAYEIEVYWTDRSKRWSCHIQWNEGRHGAVGATISEALARLVVAVGEQSR